ncbi:MAG: hypothetical protein NNA23_12515 [Nitrospira sp.]|nr:hypothetical protein [Nitrospira sp.]MCP9464319.1 hypothetical protein [Nitrospira sp.]
MTQIIRSGAFLQQCWSIHPLCVRVTRLEGARTVVLACSSCKSAHYVTAELVMGHESLAKESVARQETGREPGDLLLADCVRAHQHSVVLREMDVFQDLVVLRCGMCRRHYTLQVASFETHQA